MYPYLDKPVADRGRGREGRKADSQTTEAGRRARAGGQIDHDPPAILTMVPLRLSLSPSLPLSASIRSDAIRTDPVRLCLLLPNDTTDGMPAFAGRSMDKNSSDIRSSSSSLSSIAQIRRKRQQLGCVNSPQRPEGARRRNSRNLAFRYMAERVGWSVGRSIRSFRLEDALPHVCIDTATAPPITACLFVAHGFRDGFR